jgi:hypothetical protein
VGGYGVDQDKPWTTPDSATRLTESIRDVGNLPPVLYDYRVHLREHRDVVLGDLVLENDQTWTFGTLTPLGVLRDDGIVGVLWV